MKVGQPGTKKTSLTSFAWLKSTVEMASEEGATSNVHNLAARNRELARRELKSASTENVQVSATTSLLTKRSSRTNLWLKYLNMQKHSGKTIKKLKMGKSILSELKRAKVR